MPLITSLTLPHSPPPFSFSHEFTHPLLYTLSSSAVFTIHDATPLRGLSSHPTYISITFLHTHSFLTLLYINPLSFHFLCSLMYSVLHSDISLFPSFLSKIPSPILRSPLLSSHQSSSSSFVSIRKAPLSSPIHPLLSTLHCSSIMQISRNLLSYHIFS